MFIAKVVYIARAKTFGQTVGPMRTGYPLQTLGSKNDFASAKLVIYVHNVLSQTQVWQSKTLSNRFVNDCMLWR
jgi:hypothetical protein